MATGETVILYNTLIIFFLKSTDFPQAVKTARSVCGFSNKIEVECRSLEEAREAAGAEADIIMLDNFQPQVQHVKTLVYVSFYYLIFNHSVALHKVKTPPPPCLKPLGAACCSPSTEGRVPNFKDRSQWRSDS